MSITQNTCGCATGTTSDVGPAAEPCGCGCCGTPAPTREQRVAELRSSREVIDRQLAELENG